MKVAISVPDDTFERAEQPRSLDALDDEETTDAINSAIAGLPVEGEFTSAAAAVLASDDHN